MADVAHAFRVLCRAFQPDITEFRVHSSPASATSRAWHCILRSLAGLTRFSHHLTVEARNEPATTAVRLLAVLNVLFKYARIIQEMRRRASRALC